MWLGGWQPNNDPILTPPHPSSLPFRFKPIFTRPKSDPPRGYLVGPVDKILTLPKELHPTAHCSNKLLLKQYEYFFFISALERRKRRKRRRGEKVFSRSCAGSLRSAGVSAELPPSVGFLCLSPFHLSFSYQSFSSISSSRKHIIITSHIHCLNQQHPGPGLLPIEHPIGT